MYRPNTQWSTLFVVLSLLSSGLSIVAVGLLVDYSGSVLVRSEVSLVQQPTPVAVTGTFDSGVNAIHTSEGPLDVTTALRTPFYIQENGQRGDLPANSLLVDMLLDRITQRNKVVDIRTNTDLVTLKPAALDIEIETNLLPFGSRLGNTAQESKYRQSSGG